MTTAINPAIIERAAAALVVRLIHDCGVDWCGHDLMAVQTNFEREVRAALQSAIPEAVAEEREACAKIAEMFSINKTPIHPDVPWIAMGDAQRHVAHMTCQCMAKAIRARSAEQKGEGNG